MKKNGLALMVLAVLFITGCGDDGGNNGKKPSVNLSIQAGDVTAYVGVQKTIPVTATNTDFTVSVNPSTGSGCVRSQKDDSVVCTPAKAGTYTVTITATADATKKVEKTVRVPEGELFAGDEQILFADETESETIEFNAAEDWTATVADSDGDVPAWITLSTPGAAVMSNSSNETIGVFDNEAEGASTISGTAGNNVIIIILQPNDSGQDRSATIIIATENGWQVEITITQKYVTGDGTPYDTPGAVMISISPKTAIMTVGESRTFSVTAKNTDFTVSASPAAGSGCVKSGDNVACMPATAGTYTVTVKATADTSKTSDLVLTVNPAASTADPLALINSGNSALKNELYDEAIAYYEEAYAADNNNMKAIIYSALGKIAKISTDPKVANLLKNKFGFSAYPATLNALLNDSWLKEYADYLEWGYYDEALGDWVGWYDEWAVDAPYYPNVTKVGYYYGDCWYDPPYYTGNCTFVSDEARYSTYKLPELLIPSWVSGGSDSRYSGTLVGANKLQSFNTWTLLFIANVIDKNPNGLNAAIDELISSIFEGSFVEALERVKKLENNKTATITLDRDFIDALHLNDLMDEHDPVGWAELNGITSMMTFIKASLEWVAAYDLNTDLSFLRFAWENDDSDFFEHLKSVIDPKDLPFNNNFMDARSDGAAKMETAKASFITAIEGLKASYDAMLESPLYPTAVKDAYPTINDGIGKLITAINNGGKFWIPEDPTTGTWPSANRSDVLAGVDMGLFFQPGYLSLKNLFETDAGGRPVFYIKHYLYECTAYENWGGYDYCVAGIESVDEVKLTKENYVNLIDNIYDGGSDDWWGSVGLKLKSDTINKLVFDSPKLHEEAPELKNGDGYFVEVVPDIIPREFAKIIFEKYYF